MTDTVMPGMGNGNPTIPYGVIWLYRSENDPRSPALEADTLPRGHLGAASFLKKTDVGVRW